MIIVFGVARHGRTIEELQLHCTGCGADRLFRRKRIGLYFFVYYVPLVRLRETDEVYVECTVCEAKVSPTAAPEAGAGAPGSAPRERVILSVLAGALVAGEEDSELVREELRRAYRRLAGSPLESGAVDLAVQRAVADGESAAAMVSMLKEPGDREDLRRAAHALATVRGDPGPQAKAYLSRLDACCPRGPAAPPTS